MAPQKDLKLVKSSHESNHHVILNDSEGSGDFVGEVESHYIENSLEVLGEMKSSKNLEGQNQA